MKKVLHLTLKKKWFDMIASGVKKEEYREIKSYWIKRLVNEDGSSEKQVVFNFGEGDVVVFYHGYAKDRPQLTVELIGISIRRGKPEWGAVQDEKYLVIELGKILSRK